MSSCIMDEEETQSITDLIEEAKRELKNDLDEVGRKKRGGGIVEGSDLNEEDLALNNDMEDDVENNEEMEEEEESSDESGEDKGKNKLVVKKKNFNLFF